MPSVPLFITRANLPDLEVRFSDSEKKIRWYLRSQNEEPQKSFDRNWKLRGSFGS